ncbi:MAG: hypothetical protein F6K17_22200 [Okeania sp. SIO3C4]|nr:hypothetical protein [Okeania sp. SIO3B3]NER05110.1 hypothetical protein [Okeania sp. SIO3C4]
MKNNFEEGTRKKSMGFVDTKWEVVDYPQAIVDTLFCGPKAEGRGQKAEGKEQG